MGLRRAIRNSAPYRAVEDVTAWRRRRYASPSPHFIKQACLLRNGAPGATWVETGTYLGFTTRVLSRVAPMVYSIEPEPTLFARARSAFEGVANVEILNGTSESVFPTLLPRLSGDVSFWLDGHWSAGITFKGSKVTPIIDELRAIAVHRPRLGKLTILVDDVRLFDRRHADGEGYPPLDDLVDWARANAMHWHIEHDIFVARNH